MNAKDNFTLLLVSLSLFGSVCVAVTQHLTFHVIICATNDWPLAVAKYASNKGMPAE